MNVTNPHTATRTIFYNERTGTDLALSDVPKMPGYEVAHQMWGGNERPHRVLVFCAGVQIGMTNGCSTYDNAFRAGFALAVAHEKANAPIAFQPEEDPNAWMARDAALIAKRLQASDRPMVLRSLVPERA
jgi:hypothetical protein